MPNQFDEIRDLLEGYSVKCSLNDHKCEIELVENSGKMLITDEGNQFTLFDDDWHEHLQNVSELKTLLTNLFEERAHVVIKCFGESPAGHQLQLRDGESVQVLHQTMLIFVPFWRKRSYYRLSYLRGKKTRVKSG